MGELTAEVVHLFSSAYLNSRYDNAVPTPDFHLKVWEYCCSDHNQVAIAAPRAHAKSTAGTLAYPLASLLFEQKDFVLIISNTERQAVSFLLTLAKELEENKKIHETFGKPKFLTDTKTEIILKMPSGRTFCVMARGAGQSLRGAKWGHKRPDLVLFDDIEDDDMVCSKERREDFRNWVDNAAIPIMSKNGQIRIFGTILHLDSMLERYMPEYQVPEDIEDKDQYIVREPLCTYCTYPKVDWHSVRYRAHDKDFEHILWPDMFSQERLESIRRRYARNGNPEGYAQEYLNYPIDDATAFFKKDDFIEYENFGKEPLNYYIGTDFAVTSKNKSDYSVFVIAGMNPDGVLCVVNVIRARMDSLEIGEMFELLNQRYNPEYFIVEKGTIWNAMKPHIDKAMFEKGQFFNIKELPTTGDKMARAQAIQRRMRAGAAKFRKDTQWYPTFEEELIRFPKDVHDDQVDAWSIIGLALKEIMSAPTIEELEWDEYEEELEEHGMLTFGASKYTGY